MWKPDASAAVFSCPSPSISYTISSQWRSSHPCSSLDMESKHPPPVADLSEQDPNFAASSSSQSSATTAVQHVFPRTGTLALKSSSEWALKECQFSCTADASLLTESEEILLGKGKVRTVESVASHTMHTIEDLVTDCQGGSVSHTTLPATTEPQSAPANRLENEDDPPLLDMGETSDAAFDHLEPATRQSEAVAVVRRLLSEGRVHTAIEAVNFWFCQPKPSPRVVRMIHYNSSNWPIIPYIPVDSRDVRDKEWGRKLHLRLKRTGLWVEYSRLCGIVEDADDS